MSTLGSRIWLGALTCESARLSTKRPDPGSNPPAPDGGREPVRRETAARIPTEMGEFQLLLYRSETEGKDHLALVHGDVTGARSVMVRIHSECFTGDVLGSLRCDCGEQLERALFMVAEAGCGVVIYLRQEGRGIGLLEKLRAYNLQDAGYDTVEANLELGHQADERDYAPAVEILRDLGIESIRLLTNNPLKLEGLKQYGYDSVERLAIEVTPKPENVGYLETKVKRMRHLLDLDALLDDEVAAPRSESASGGTADKEARLPLERGLRIEGQERPWVTLSYAQSLDGSITSQRGHSLTLSSPEAMEMTHKLRARHDGILVGIGTVLADDPRLTVRLVSGDHPRPIVLDSKLRTPLDAQLLSDPPMQPWIATTEQASDKRQQELERRGARVLRVPSDERGLVSLERLLPVLQQEGLDSLMVEGGAQVITSFLLTGLVDRMVVTVAPRIVGGLNALATLTPAQQELLPRLEDTRFRWVGSSLVLFGHVAGLAEEELLPEEFFTDGAGLSGAL